MKNQVAGFNRFHARCDGNESHTKLRQPSLNQTNCLALPHTTHVKTPQKQSIFGDEFFHFTLWELGGQAVGPSVSSMALQAARTEHSLPRTRS
jgi:hypothetical protein